MRALLAALIVAATAISFAQTRVWLKTTSRPGTDNFSDVVTDPAGNVFACGNTIDPVSTKIAMLAVKFDKNGVKIWEKAYPGIGGHSFATAIAVDPNGHVVIVGQTGWNPPADGKARVLRLSAAAGDILFENVTNFPSQWHDVVVDRLGEISATGWIGSPKSMRTSHFLPSGTLAWTRDYNYPGLVNSADQTGRHVLVDINQNVYVCGVNNGFPGSTYNTVVKYDRTGLQLWMKHKSYGFRDYPRGFVMLPNNRTAMTMETSFSGDPQLRTSVVEYDANGVEVFNNQRSVGTSNSIKGMASDRQGGYYFASAAKTSSSGIFCEVSAFSTPFRSLFQGLGLPDVRSIAAASNGDFYVGTNETGSGPRKAQIQAFHMGPNSGELYGQWNSFVFGSSANGQIPYALPQALTCDSKGDLIAVFNASGALSQDGFIAKYETYPVCRGDEYNVTPGVTFNSPISVLDNDMQYTQGTVALSQAPQRGTITFNANGNFTYVPGANFANNDFFVYSITRSNGATVQSDSVQVQLR